MDASWDKAGILPVWMVRSRQVAARARFWLALFGYNQRDRSLGHKVYLVYAALFYLVWGFAVLSLLAVGAARLLETAAQAWAGPGAAYPLAPAAVGLGSLALAAWWLGVSYRAARRSPFHFSEDDAHLICQTPLDRRTVSLAWLAGRWLEAAPFVAALAAVLGFGLAEAGSPQGLSAADLPAYLLAGASSLGIILPLHLGLTALAWALGALRLRRDRQRNGLWLLPAGFGLILLILLLLSWRGPASQLWLSLLGPVSFPLRGAFGLLPWPLGFGLALAVGGLGLLLLASAARGLNLSRAALESRRIVARENAVLAGAFRQVEIQERRERLGTSRPPSRWLVAPRWDRLAGPAAAPLALVLKDQAQAGRSRRLGGILAWLGIFGAALSIFSLEEWGLRAWALLLWIALIQGQASRRLVSDLEMWALLRQLPIPGWRLALAEAAWPLVYTCLLAWAALGVARLWLAPVPWEAYLLAPFLALAAILAGQMDVLRQSKTSELLAGRAPQPGWVGVAVGAGLAGLAAFLTARFGVVGSLLALLLLLAGAAALAGECARNFRTMR